MPLLRIKCLPTATAGVLKLLGSVDDGTEPVVFPGVSHPSRADVIFVDLHRSEIDPIIDTFTTNADPAILLVSVDESERLIPQLADDDEDSESVIWSEVAIDIHERARLSWINVLLVVTAAAIAAVGIIEDELLLIVGAMAMSPDYYPVVDTCVSVVRRDWARALQRLGTLTVAFAAAALGAWALTETLIRLDVVRLGSLPSRQLTDFISHPDALSIVVAVLAGIAGALAITLPDTRGLVGVFVSITTIPAAANIGVAAAGGDRSEMAGAAVQLLVNVVSLTIAGTITLEVRHRTRHAIRPLRRLRHGRK